MINRGGRATLAEQTLKVIERGYYQAAASKKPIQLAKQLQQAVTNTKLYTPADKPALFRFAKNEIKLNTISSSLPAYLQTSIYENKQEEGDSQTNFEDLTTTTTTTTSTDTPIKIDDNNNNNNTNNTFKATIFSNNKPINQATVDSKPTNAEPNVANTTTTTTTAASTTASTMTHQTIFEVRHGTTLEAAYALAFDGKHPKTCVLNFASAKNPGGGFLGGSQAQEESLARSSGLYPCLNSKAVEVYYTENRRDDTCLYTNHIIYSPLVPVFRSDDGNLLEEPYFPSFITAPAVNWGAAFKRVSDPLILVNTMKERAAMFLGVAVEHEEDTLVLGAWGCGVFRFPPEVCAEIFYSLLVPETAPFYNTFKHVVFAITDPKLCTLFSKVLAEGPVPAEPTDKHGRPADRASKGHHNNNNKRSEGRHGNDKHDSRPHDRHSKDHSNNKKSTDGSGAPQQRHNDSKKR